MRTVAPLAQQRPSFGTIVRTSFGIPAEHVDACLRVQRQSGGRIGSLLLRRGLITRAQLCQVLREQARWVAQTVRGGRSADGPPFDTYLSICLPAYNEAANIEDTLDAACAILPEFVRRFEVVVVDDGSRDDTAGVVARYAGEEPRVRLVRHERNRGYGAAVTSGLRAAQGELVMFTDSDGQFSFLDLAGLLSLMPGNDVVVGYRYRRADPPIRRLNAWLWSRLVRLVLRVRVRDLNCAFKLFRREVLERLELTATGAAINVQIHAQCANARLRIRETPVSHYPRYHGAQTGAALSVIGRAFRELPQLLKYRTRPVPAPAEPAALAVNGDDGRLKVCMLAACPFPASHGTPGSIRELAEGVVECGHEVHLVTYHFGEDIPVRGPHVHRIRPLTGESTVVVGPTARRPLYDLQLVFKTLQVIRATRPDLIHAHGYEAALAAGICGFLTGLPIVYSGHNTMSDELPSFQFIKPHCLGVGVARFLDALVPRLGDRCLPHSANMEAFFRGMGLAGRTEPAVPFGIDLHGLDHGDGAAVRRRYDLGRGPVIVYAGVLDRFQRLDLLLEAMPTVLHYEPGAKLLLVVTIDQPKHAAVIRRRAEELKIAGQVILTEPQPLAALPDFLAAADVTVVPRPQAPGFPIKLLNYLAARKPCVLFASSASSGLVHEENVFLVAGETATDLGTGLLEVLRDDELRARIARNGYDFVCRHHDRRRVAQQVCAVYRRTLAGAGRRVPAVSPAERDLLTLIARGVNGRGAMPVRPANVETGVGSGRREAIEVPG